MQISEEINKIIERVRLEVRDALHCTKHLSLKPSQVGLIAELAGPSVTLGLINKYLRKYKYRADLTDQTWQSGED